MTMMNDDNNISGQFARVNSVVTMVLGGAGICGNLLSVIVLSRPVMYFQLYFLLIFLALFIGPRSDHSLPMSVTN